MTERYTGWARWKCLISPEHGRGRFALCVLEDRADEGGERGLRLGTRVLHVEADRRCDLIVAGAAGMDCTPYFAELGLDEGVDVLRGRICFTQSAQAFPHLGELGVVEDSGHMQPLDVEERPRTSATAAQLGVVGAKELPHRRRKLIRDPPRPERPVHSGGTSSRSRSACVSAMSFACTASWPIRSRVVNVVALRSMLSRSGS